MDITSRLKARVRQIMVQEMFVRTPAVDRVQRRIEQAIEEELGVGRVHNKALEANSVTESDQPDLYGPSAVPG